VPALSELCEERLQGSGVSARPHPHDRARSVIADRGQVALAAPVGDLVDADLDEPLEPAFVEVIAHDALDDPPDRVPAHPQEPCDRRLGHLLGEEGREVLEVARVAGAGPCPRDRLHSDAAVGAAHPAQAVLDQAARGAEVKVAPAPQMAVVDCADDLAAARARRSPAPPQGDLDDHPLGSERDVDDPGAGQAQQAVECGGGAHVVPPWEPLTSDSQQPPRAARARRYLLRKLGEATKRAGSRPSPGIMGGSPGVGVPRERAETR